MASAAEQLASNLNWGAIGKATELKKRLWFTIGALIVFRIGAYIPVPGVDPAALAEMFQHQAGGIAGMPFEGINPLRVHARSKRFIQQPDFTVSRQHGHHAGFV